MYMDHNINFKDYHAQNLNAESIDTCILLSNRMDFSEASFPSSGFHSDIKYDA